MNIDRASRRFTGNFFNIGLLLLLLILVVFYSQLTMAAGGLVVTPQLVELDHRTRSKVLTLANRGKGTETYRISIINYRMDENGNLTPTETPSENEGFANGLFRYAPRQITLKPGKPQTVRILYRRPKNLQEGEYRSHLLFQQIPEAKTIAKNTGNGPGLSFKIETIFGITIPVIVRHGQLQAQGQISNLKTATVKTGKGISMRISREGQRSLRGDLVALAGSEEIGRLNNVAVYMSTPHRNIVMSLDPEKSGSATGNDITVEYRERGATSGPVIASGNVTLH
ncbi:MAG: fimbria/pilus periplasmic chaperone [Sneathiella sp.]|nr:fimbria/pilus periplasmic chaperone [Sneathiella sp.]